MRWEKTRGTLSHLIGNSRQDQALSCTTHSQYACSFVSIFVSNTIGYLACLHASRADYSCGLLHCCHVVLTALSAPFHADRGKHEWTNCEFKMPSRMEEMEEANGKARHEPRSGLKAPCVISIGPPQLSDSSVYANVC